MADPIAYFMTFSAYGNRLHGDERGTVDAAHNAIGSAMRSPEPGLVEWERAQMRGTQMAFTAQMRTVIESSLEQTCGYRMWHLLASHCRTNHLHLVVAATDPIERVMHDLKSYSTRALRTASLVAGDRPVWARHGSVRSLFNERAVELAIAYTLDAQGTDLPGTMASRIHREDTHH